MNKKTNEVFDKKKLKRIKTNSHKSLQANVKSQYFLFLQTDKKNISRSCPSLHKKNDYAIINFKNRCSLPNILRKNIKNENLKIKSIEKKSSKLKSNIGFQNKKSEMYTLFKNFNKKKILSNKLVNIHLILEF